MDIIFKHAFEDVYGVSPASLNKPLRNSDSVFDGVSYNQYIIRDKNGNSYTVQSMDSFEDVQESMNSIFEVDE